VGKNCHSIKNTKELVDKLRGLEILLARKLVSYDVTALFTSVAVDKALEVITERLHEDDTLTSRTETTIPQIVELLDFCLNTTYFIYDWAYYQQTHGAAMGSPISPLVGNCYMEQFEKIAISTALHPHHCGYDTWMTHSLYFTNTTWKSSRALCMIKLLPVTHVLVDAWMLIVKPVYKLSNVSDDLKWDISHHLHSLSRHN